MNTAESENKRGNPIGKGTCNLGVNVPTELAEAAKDAAWREKKKLSEWLRDAIKDRIEKTLHESGQLTGA